MKSRQTRTRAGVAGIPEVDLPEEAYRTHMSEDDGGLMLRIQGTIQSLHDTELAFQMSSCTLSEHGKFSSQETGHRGS